MNVEGESIMAEAMETEQQVAEQTRRAAQHGIERMREGEPTKSIMEMQEMIPSPIYAYAAGASVLASALLFFTRRSKDWALFVGQWAPTILAMGLFYKALKPSRE
jgi:hypothetical protein